MGSTSSGSSGIHDGWRNGSASLVAADSHGLRILLKERVCNGAARGIGDNVKIVAGRIVLVLALGIGRINTRSSRPLPNPVEGQCLARLYEGLVGGKHNVRLTPLLMLRGRLASNVIWELLLALGRNWATVNLVATAVVKVHVTKKASTLITARAVLGPLKDVHELLVRFRVGSAHDQDGPALLWLASLILRQGDVTVLKVLHGDGAPWSNSKTWILGTLMRRALRRMAEQICLVDLSSSSLSLWNEIHHAIASVSGISASDVASRIAVRASVLAVGPNERKLFIPAVSQGGLCEGRGQKSSGKESQGG